MTPSSPRRQPAHTVYGGAQLFRHDTARKLGELARAALDEYAPDAGALAAALGIDDPELAATVYARVVSKLEREPVEDLRIDFEDGYGVRPDAEEDGHAASVAREVAAGLAAGSLPRGIGIRIKSLSGAQKTRALRTLVRFVGELVDAAGGELPAGFVVTLPKITAPDEVAELAAALAELERRHDLRELALPLELMVETPQSIFDARGAVALPALVAAAAGRCVGAHFGTYDYTASLGITAGQQRMGHPACDFAKQVMQVALAGTAVDLSDGATNVLPVPLHRARPGGEPLTRAELADNRRAVHAAWRLHAADVRRSLEQGFFQGWDLHPAQLVSRWSALYAFFLDGLDDAGARLRNFVDKAAQATLVGDVFDDAATGQGLLNYFLRALSCGAIDEDEALARTGLSAAELATRSFPAILAGRRDTGG